MDLGLCRRLCVRRPADHGHRSLGEDHLPLYHRDYIPAGRVAWALYELGILLAQVFGDVRGASCSAMHDREWLGKIYKFALQKVVPNKKCRLFLSVDGN